MTRRHYEDFLASYVEIISPKGEAPARFHFWTAVHTIAGALRRRVYFDAGTFKWYPNFYIILVGPPGIVKKSTVINIGARLLREVPNVIVGADCTTWQQFVQEVAEAKDFFAEGDPQSLDEEALLNRTHTVTSALSLEISELGTFLNTDDRDMINILTELWDCKLDQKFVKATKTQGSDEIMNPFVNIIAGTTPAWMNDNFRGRIGGWGLSSRCIFLHASRPDRRIALPHLEWKGEHDAIMAKFREDLIDIAKLQGGCILTPEAQEFFTAWYIAHGERHERLESHPHRDPWLSYYMARKHDNVMKLAIVLTAARRDTLIITLQDAQDAVARCDEIEEELSHVFQTKEAVDRDAKVRTDVWNGICRGLRKSPSGELLDYKLHGYCSQFMSGGKAKELITQLIESRYLYRRGENGNVFYGLGDAAVVDESKMGEIPTVTLSGTLRRSQSPARPEQVAPLPVPRDDLERQR